MGQPHSTSQRSSKLPLSITNNFSFKNQQDYQFIKQITRSNVPSNNIYLFSNSTDKKHYTLRIVILSMEEELLGLQKIIEKRKKIKSLHLCNLKQSITQEESMTCATIHRLALLIQCPPKSLKQEFQVRKNTLHERKPEYFKQSQLWAIAYSVVHGLKELSSYGIHHQSLDLQEIYVEKNGLIKLGDPILFGLQKNYIAALRQKQTCGRKLSPQLINFLEECNFFFYDKEKSDIFILGLVLLEATLLKEVSVYNFRTKQKKFGLLSSFLLQVKCRYSQKYHKLLSWMIEIQPKNRPKYIDLADFIQVNNVQGSSSNESSKHPLESSKHTPTPSNYISPISSQRQFKHLLICPEGVLQNRTNKQSFDQKNFIINFNQNYRQQITNNVYSHNYSNYGVNFNLDGQNHKIEPSPIKHTNLGSTSNNKADSQANSDIVFPFQLVYNRIVNNNQNLRPFELPKLYQQYKVQMFNSSCRGSVPSSSFHQKKLQRSNQNMKLRDIQTFSQKYGIDQFEGLPKNTKHGPTKNSKHQSYQPSEKYQTNLIYSNSSGLNSSKRVFSSANSLGDIKLIQSNHYINEYHNIDVKLNKKNQIQQIIQESVASSPYRKLDSMKSKSILQNDSGNYNSNTVFSSLKLPEYDYKAGGKQEHKYQNNNHNYKEQYSNFKLKDNNKKVLQELQLEYYSMQTKKNDNSNLQSFKSQLLHKSKLNKNQMLETIQIKQERFANFQKFTMFDFKDEVIASKNQLLEQSQMNSKLSVYTPNFYEKDISKNSNDFLQNSKRQDLQYVQGQESIQGNIYTGFKSKIGLKQGNGKLQFHDGGYYDGQWKNNQMNGYGEMYYENGQVAYKGSWKNDHFCGSGKVYNDRPQSFTAQFDYRDFSQIGQKWLSYQGQFDSDSKHGKGRIDLTNGQYFQGTFDYDMIEGYGTYFTKNQNKVIRGVWRDNQLIQSI